MPDRVSMTPTRQAFGFRHRHCQGPRSKCRTLLCDRYELAALRGDGATIRCKAGWAHPSGVASGRPLGSPFCISQAPHTSSGAAPATRLPTAEPLVTCRSTLPPRFCASWPVAVGRGNSSMDGLAQCRRSWRPLRRSMLGSLGGEQPRPLQRLISVSLTAPLKPVRSAPSFLRCRGRQWYRDPSAPSRADRAAGP